MDDLVIGIDLGTTNSCAAYYIDGKVKIIENNAGERTTPTVLYFSPNGVIIGKQAKQLAEGKPQLSVYEIKRLIGRKFDDPYTQHNLQYYPFKLDNSSSDAVIVVELGDKTIKLIPLEVYKEILSKIKVDVEARLGHPVNKAVITVPAYFNVTQREITLNAASLAGFQVLKLLNEPTAAALSYYVENSNTAEDHSLVFDLGGGTFDVAILKRCGDQIDILSVDGDNHLGGQDLDNLLVDYVCDHLKNEYNYDLRSDQRKMRLLHDKCEETKRTLSSVEETTITLEAFIEEEDWIEITLTKEEFEKMADEFFERTIQVVDECLMSCNLRKCSIDEIILCGGSTRIPKLRNLITEFFHGKELNKFVNPDECVAEGAALQAAMLSTNPRQKINTIQITDVVPLSLGISDLVNVMDFVIKRNTPIPVSETKNYYTVLNEQKSLSVHVYEGERLNAKKNRYLGKITITDLTPAPPGECEVNFTMTVDANGILIISAKEKFKDNVKNLTVTYTRGHRSDSEVRNVLKDAEENKLEDQKFLRFAGRKEYLINYCIKVIYNLEQKNLIGGFREIYDRCHRVKESALKLDVDDIPKLKEMTKEIKGLCKPLVKEYHFELMPKRRKE